MAAGSFTGAGPGRAGLFQDADGGTLLIDRVDLMERDIQAKLLSAIESGEVRPLGGAAESVDVRVIATTSSSADRWRSPRERGDVLEALRHRLAGLVVSMPPLRTRRADLPALAKELLAAAGWRGELNPEALGRLSAYGWPGNLRELDHEMSRLAHLGVERIGAEVLSPEVRRARSRDAGASRVDPAEEVERAEREVVLRALAEAQREPLGGGEDRRHVPARLPQENEAARRRCPGDRQSRGLTAGDTMAAPVRRSPTTPVPQACPSFRSNRSSTCVRSRGRDLSVVRVRAGRHRR